MFSRIANSHISNQAMSLKENNKNSSEKRLKKIEENLICIKNSATPTQQPLKIKPNTSVNHEKETNKIPETLQKIKNNAEPKSNITTASCLGLNPVTSRISTHKGYKVYIDPCLADRQSIANRLAEKNMSFIKENFSNEQEMSPYVARSMRNKSSSDHFQNKYKPWKWTFLKNHRSASDSNYFANDIARHQYAEISKKMGFYGVLPSTIVRSNVQNPTTLNKTKGIQSGSPEMLDVFMNQTPNGRSTQRILKDFGLQATKVEIFAGKFMETSFKVHVEPISKAQFDPLLYVPPVLPESDEGDEWSFLRGNAEPTD